MRTLSVKLRQERAGRTLLEEGRTTREVEAGSNFEAAGVWRAFRFWLIVSSMVPRDVRKKSDTLVSRCIRKSPVAGHSTHLSDFVWRSRTAATVAGG